MNTPREIWTIGHSLHSAEYFLAMLKSFEIAVLADVRRFPGSRKYPHFNKDALSSILREHGIEYVHFEDLGGRRSPRLDSRNTAWRVTAFKGYADHMENESFHVAISALEAYAMKQRMVYMCSEAVWWSCHRALISDYLKSTGWNVRHIMAVDKSQEHPYTKPARIVNQRLVYSAD